MSQNRMTLLFWHSPSLQIQQTASSSISELGSPFEVKKNYETSLHGHHNITLIIKTFCTKNDKGKYIRLQITEQHLKKRNSGWDTRVIVKIKFDSSNADIAKWTIKLNIVQ